MKNSVSSRNAVRLLCVIALACGVGTSISQTPAQQEAERIRKMNEDLRRQEEEALSRQRRQQEEAARARDQQFNQNMQDAQRRQQDAQNQSQGDPASAKLEQARQAWLKRPALPPDRNPLLGRWTRPSSARTDPANPFAIAEALVKGGLCELFFGGGVFEFRPDRLVGMDERTREQELDRVEYRGDAKRVVVIPKTTFKLIEFDFEGPDRINWASQKCVLVRVGAAANSAPATKPAQADLQRANPGSGSGALMLLVGPASAENKVAGRGFMILNRDPQALLINAGWKPTPDGSVLQNWVRACLNRTPNCEKGAQALRPHNVATAMTDANGKAWSAALPAGRYWVHGDAEIGGKRLMWNEPVDVKAGSQSLTFDQRNAMPVE